MRLVEIDRDELALGNPVTVWRAPDGHCGQGGVVMSVTEDSIGLVCGTHPDIFEVHTDWDDVHHVTIEQALDPDECLNFGGDCEGAVDYHTTGTSDRAWPRCDFHQALRDKSHEHSIERFAGSDCEPAWLDPSYAGESW